MQQGAASTAVALPPKPPHQPQPACGRACRVIGSAASGQDLARYNCFCCRGRQAYAASTCSCKFDSAWFAGCTPSTDRCSFCTGGASCCPARRGLKGAHLYFDPVDRGNRGKREKLALIVPNRLSFRSCRQLPSVDVPVLGEVRRLVPCPQHGLPRSRMLRVLASSWP